jgi:sirohydrochlorin ferrochelatase
MGQMCRVTGHLTTKPWMDAIRAYRYWDILLVPLRLGDGKLNDKKKGW